jgi:hypothetical protein
MLLIMSRDHNGKRRAQGKIGFGLKRIKAKTARMHNRAIANAATMIN